MQRKPLRNQTPLFGQHLRWPKKCPPSAKLAGGIAALSLALLLCGCGQTPASSQAVSPRTSPLPIPTAASGLYAPGSEMEISTQGAVRAYPLGTSDARALLAHDGGLLVFSGETTALTLLTGENLAVSASTQLTFPLSPQDPSLCFHGNSLSYYDPIRQETVVLDNALTPVSHIAAPAGLSGTPVLSSDRNTLAYCTGSALISWDLESGIHRTVKEMAYPGQSAAGLWEKDSIIQCAAEGSQLFVAADTGRLVEQWKGDLTLETLGERYFAGFPLGFDTALVYGSGESARILMPEAAGGACFLPRNNAVVTVTAAEDNAVCLDCYDLSTGRRLSQLTLDTQVFPKSITGADGYVYLLMTDETDGTDVICRWDPAQTPIRDDTVYSEPYLLAPQEQDLDACRRLAEEIAAEHGIQILIGKAAVKAQPWDFHLEAEVQPAILFQALQGLRQRLRVYPEGMLADTASNFSDLALCLVRSVTGSAESGSVHDATGVQFLEDGKAYVAITCGQFSGQALYHELFHAMETHIWGSSTAFDQWETLNPAGFQYDYSYSANALRDSGIYLQTEFRSFIDTYSMSFPKEDRARIFEYALDAENASYFETEVMQNKLITLCRGIREAYGLESSPERYLWEQHLKKPLASAK